LLQDLLHTFDRITILMQQLVDPARKLYIFGTIIAPVSCARDRAKLAEPRFPISQHMLRHTKINGEFANRPKRSA